MPVEKIPKDLTVIEAWEKSTRRLADHAAIGALIGGLTSIIVFRKIYNSSYKMRCNCFVIRTLECTHRSCLLWNWIWSGNSLDEKREEF